MSVPSLPHRHDATCPVGRSQRRRRIAAAGLALSGCALVGGGAFSSWNVTTNAASGTLSAASGAATLLDANGGTFTTGVANLLPGDFFYRYVDVRNDGTAANTFTGTVSATGDLAGQVAVAGTRCSVAWTTVDGASTCTGTSTPLGSGTPGAGAPVSIAHGTIDAGAPAAQHVRYEFTFSTGAPETLQGKTGNVAIAVSNTLVGGTDRTDR